MEKPLGSRHLARIIVELLPSIKAKLRY